MIYFPFSDYWMFYAGFTLFVLMMLALDLGVFHKKAHIVSIKEATTWTIVWVTLAIIFNFLFYKYALWKFTSEPSFLSLPDFNGAEKAKTLALEFLTGFVIEKSLAIDNIFIFAVVFSYFGIPKIYQHRILFWGIFGALFFRAIFIALGTLLLKYEWVAIFFGILLIVTGIKMFFAGTEEVNLDKNVVIRFLRKIFKIHPTVENDKFFIKKDNLTYVTPLFIALIFLELTDIIFAVDSVPAIFAITKEPFIVYTSNIFAILGLRSMYFMLASVIDRFRFIKYGLAAVLVFVGLKMSYLNELYGGKFPISWSLMIITGLIGGSILMSLIVDSKNKKGKE